MNKESSSFYGAGSDRMLGNGKGVGVPVFTNRKKKDYQKAKQARVTLSERATSYYISVGKAYIRFSPCRYLSRSDRKQFPLYINKSKYTSVLLEGHFSSSNTAFPVTRPHALSNVIIQK